jgi:hypothetical protein
MHVDKAPNLPRTTYLNSVPAYLLSLRMCQNLSPENVYANPALIHMHAMAKMLDLVLHQLHYGKAQCATSDFGSSWVITSLIARTIQHS